MFPSRTLSPSLVLALAVAGCYSNPSLSEDLFLPPVEQRPAGEPRADFEEDYAADGKTLLRTKQVLVYPGGQRVRHGEEREWYRDGELRHVRHYEHGEPVGTWTSFHPDGTPWSEVHCGPETGTTTWWHANGVLSARGATVRGVKEGEWTHWHEDGSIAEEGSYGGGVRDGAWTSYHPNGGVREQGTYVNGVRVGEWIQLAPDGTPVLEEPEGEEDGR